MPKKPAEVTDTELAILDILWDRDQCEIREIVESLYPEHTPARHATVKSLLERLAEKGFVECNKKSFAHRFSARISRETHVGKQLQEMANNHFNGSLSPMLLALVDRVKLSRKQREAIRKIVDGVK